MEIKDLKARQGNVEVVAKVVEKGEVREFEKFGKRGRVCTAVVEDESGKINLTLWNEDIEKVDVGDKIQITNGYVNEFKGELQLTAGRMGKLEVVEKATKLGEGKEEKEEKKEEEKPVEEPKEELSEEPVVEEEEVS